LNRTIKTLYYSSSNTLQKSYERKDDETKKIYDENAELYLSIRGNKIADDVESIKKNVQFYFWITIIGFAISVIVIIANFE
jgi:hypothetical protein